MNADGLKYLPAKNCTLHSTKSKLYVLFMCSSLHMHVFVPTSPLLLYFIVASV